MHLGTEENECMSFLPVLIFTFSCPQNRLAISRDEQVHLAVLANFQYIEELGLCLRDVKVKKEKERGVGEQGTDIKTFLLHSLSRAGPGCREADAVARAGVPAPPPREFDKPTNQPSKAKEMKQNEEV